MLYLKKWTLLAIVLLAVVGNSFGQKEYWTNVSEPISNLKGKQQIIPQKFSTVKLDFNQFKSLLLQAPLESLVSKKTGLIVSFPMPDGSIQKFMVVESPIMEPKLAAKFPNIKTYLGQGIDDKYASMRFDITANAFHGMILSPNGAVFIDPYSSLDAEHYVSYYKKDFNSTDYFSCEVEESRENVNDSGTQRTSLSNGEDLRIYRLAVAATGEYTAFHGGTVALGQQAIVTAINRVNEVYEVELAVRLVLVANNNLIVYTNPGTDPYSNGNGGAMLSENQTNIDAIIGSANYDIGHVFSTGGGGVAGLGVVCNSAAKAKGVTGQSSPIGDPFYIDYVAHEIGHQFGGLHTFNGTSGSCSGGNRTAGTAYEPGSGSTIQAYAGICSPQNLQNHSDPYFHVGSLDEMITFTTIGAGNSCPTITANGNTAPVATAPIPTGLTIPINTPFELTGSGTDVNGDALSYCWEQYDLGPAGAPESPVGNAPLFRSFNPTTDPVRTFPRLSDLLANTITYGEILPSYARSMNFRLTLRDNRAGGGGVDWTSYAVDVSDNSGPFIVTVPNTVVTWSGGTTETVIWDVANTTAAPVNCTKVDILLSTDGGLTFPITLASGVPNDGSQDILVPNTNTTLARIKVIGSGNIFFDISNISFSIETTTCTDMTVILKDSNGDPLAGGSLEYREGGGNPWQNATEVSDGLFCIDTERNQVGLRMTYGPQVLKVPNVPTNTDYTFQMEEVTIKLREDGVLTDNGEVHYTSNGWQYIGVTGDNGTGVVKLDMLPTTYTFRMNYYGDKELKQRVISPTYNKITFHVEDLKSAELNGADEFQLTTYPNPFNGNATIAFSLDEAKEVNIAVYDQTGRLVEVLHDGIQTEGNHKILWDASNVNKGVYFVRLRSNGQIVNKNIVKL